LCPFGGAVVARCRLNDIWCCRIHQAVGTRNQEGEYTAPPQPSAGHTQVEVWHVVIDLLNIDIFTHNV